MKTLEGLQTLCIGDGNLQLGVIKACIDFLGLDVSAGWLAGATGNAFIMSISEGVDICDTYFAYASDEARAEQTRLGRNAGYELEMHLAWPNDPALEAKRAKARPALKQAIDSGMPCYGWCHFSYWTFCGYDDSGDFYIAPSEAGGKPRGPYPWKDMGGLELYIVRPGQPTDDRTAVREGLESGLAYAHGRDPVFRCSTRIYS